MEMGAAHYMLEFSWRLQVIFFKGSIRELCETEGLKVTHYA